MTTTNTTTKVVTVGNDVTTAFAFLFPVAATDEIVVELETIATGVIDPPLTEGGGADYTVALNTASEGGTVNTTVAPTSLQRIIVRRDLTLDMSLDLPAVGNVQEPQLEGEFDKQARINIQIQEQLSRAVLQSIAETGSGFTLPVAEADKLIGWNSAGTDLTNVVNQSTAAAASAAAALVSETNAAASASSASTSASNAATSETNAATSETNAAVSAAAAAASAVNSDPESVDQNRRNITVLQFLERMNQTATANSASDSWSDVFTDENRVDLPTSTNEAYDAANDTYQHVSAPSAAVNFAMNFDGVDASTTFTDGIGGRAVSVAGDAQVDTANQKFGTGSGQFDGTGDQILVTQDDANDFSLMQNAAWTISFWAKFNTTVASQGIMSCRESGTREWEIRFDANRQLDMFYDDTDDAFSINSINDILTDTASFHHIMFCLVGTDIGAYIDGTQVGFQALGVVGGTGTINANLIMGLTNNVALTLDGFIDDFFITDDNFFTAAPVVGLSDTITIPTASIFPATNMVLQSVALTPNASVQPETGYVMILADPQGGTEDTDFTASVSRDGGTTFTTVDLEEDGTFSGDVKIYSGIAAITAQPAGTSMKWKVETVAPNVAIIHAVGVQALEN